LHMRILSRSFVPFVGVLLVALALLVGQPRLSYAQESDTPVEPAAETPGPEPTPPDRPTPGPDPTDPPPDPTDPPPDPTAPPPDPTDPPPDPTTPPPPPTSPPGGGGDDDDDDPGLDLAIVKQVSSTEVNVGDVIEYVLTVTHAEGDGWADDVVIEDTLPSSVEVIDATTSWGTLTINGNTVRVEIDQLFPGDVVTVRIQARVLSIPTAENNRNDASVSTISEERTLANNRASVVIGGTSGDDDDTTATPTAQPEASPEVEPTPIEPLPTSVPDDIPPPSTLPDTGDSGGMPLLPMAGLVLLAIGGTAFMMRRRRS
jgi:fimbrial isopeptide formation D2 family protein/LPXTG-motif cell wall-anchored protein